MHNEKLRISTKQSSFNATIECVENKNNSKIKYKYYLNKNHTPECNNKFNPIIEDKRESINNKQDFINKCESIMNFSTIYDPKLYKEEFKKLYNELKYDFPLNDNLLSNIVTKWKSVSERFKSSSVLY